MLSSETRCGIPTSPLPTPSLPSVLFTCLHLISIQNGLTPLEVARAKLSDGFEPEYDTELQEEEASFKNKYQIVIGLLRGYSGEPATLPSHDVSRLTPTDTHDIVSLH